VTLLGAIADGLSGRSCKCVGHLRFPRGIFYPEQKQAPNSESHPAAWAMSPPAILSSRAASAATSWSSWNR